MLMQLKNINKILKTKKNLKNIIYVKKLLGLINYIYKSKEKIVKLYFELHKSINLLLKVEIIPQNIVNKIIIAYLERAIFFEKLQIKNNELFNKLKKRMHECDDERVKILFCKFEDKFLHNFKETISLYPKINNSTNTDKSYIETFKCNKNNLKCEYFQNKDDLNYENSQLKKQKTTQHLKFDNKKEFNKNSFDSEQEILEYIEYINSNFDQLINDKKILNKIKIEFEISPDFSKRHKNFLLQYFDYEIKTIFDLNFFSFHNDLQNEEFKLENKLKDIDLLPEEKNFFAAFLNFKKNHISVAKTKLRQLSNIKLKPEMLLYVYFYISICHLLLAEYCEAMYYIKNAIKLSKDLFFLVPYNFFVNLEKILHEKGDLKEENFFDKEKSLFNDLQIEKQNVDYINPKNYNINQNLTDCSYNQCFEDNKKRIITDSNIFNSNQNIPENEHAKKISNLCDPNQNYDFQKINHTEKLDYFNRNFMDNINFVNKNVNKDQDTNIKKYTNINNGKNTGKNDKKQIFYSNNLSYLHDYLYKKINQEPEISRNQKYLINKTYENDYNFIKELRTCIILKKL
ncbi:hypothetical protein GVAV_002286 [Gurleya vavrai]